MTKEKFLTVRWNNLLSLGLGALVLVYAVVVLSTSVLSDLVGFIGLVVIGVLCERYIIVIPGQTNPPHLFPGMTITQSDLAAGFVDYTISVPELLQALGVFGLIGVLFLLGLKYLRFAPTEARSIQGVSETESLPVVGKMLQHSRPRV